MKPKMDRELSFRGPKMRPNMQLVTKFINLLFINLYLNLLLESKIYRCEINQITSKKTKNFSDSDLLPRNLLDI